MKPLTNAERASEKRARKAEKGEGSPLERLFGGKPEGSADWGNANASYVQEVVVAMQSLGGAVTFGLSRDGGAYMLTFLLEGNRKTDWLGQGEDLDAWLEQWVYNLRTVSDK